MDKIWKTENTFGKGENTFAIYDVDHDGREELSAYVAAHFYSNGAVDAN